MAPANIDRAHIRGVEAALDGNLAGWIWRTSATWLDPRDVATGSNDGNVLPRRARRSARIDLDRTLGDFSIGGSLYGAGGRYDDLANKSRLGGYSLSDVFLTLDVATILAAQAGVFGLAYGIECLAQVRHDVELVE